MRYDLDFWTQFGATFTDEWREQAACLDIPIDTFLEPGHETEAERICSQCPVFYDCLEDALYYDDAGWRAISEKDRSSITMHRKRSIKSFKHDLGILDE
jgi:hypothetical protein